MMKNYRTALLALVAISCSIAGKSMNLEAHCKAYRQLTDDQFFEQFPYAEYLDTPLNDPLSKLIQDRAVLSLQGRGEVADFVLFEATDRYLAQAPIDVSNLHGLQAQLSIAEDFLKPQADSALSLIANSIGDRIFGTAAYRIEEGFANGKVEKDDPAFLAVLEVLTRNKYTPNIPASNTEKLLRNAQEGNWAYIWDRFKTRYLKDALLVLSLALNGLLLLRPLLRALRRKRSAPSTQVFSPISPQGNR
jgi:hypothetical protein